MMDIADEQYITDASGNRTGVILSIERYEKLIEDLHDLAAIIPGRRDETPISFEEVKRRLERDGFL